MCFQCFLAAMSGFATGHVTTEWRGLCFSQNFAPVSTSSGQPGCPHKTLGFFGIIITFVIYPCYLPVCKKRSIFTRNVCTLS